MTRIVNQPIAQPRLGPDGGPASFRWARRTHRVAAVLDSWQDIGAWWEAESEKRFWRVEVEGGGIFELWQDQAGQWAVYRVWD